MSSSEYLAKTADFLPCMHALKICLFFPLGIIYLCIRFRGNSLISLLSARQETFKHCIKVNMLHAAAWISWFQILLKFASWVLSMIMAGCICTLQAACMQHDFGLKPMQLDGKNSAGQERERDSWNCCGTRWEHDHQLVQN